MSSHYTHCPRCGETCLDVDGTANLGMSFTPGDPDGQVDQVNSYDWNGDSVTQCVRCKHSGHLHEFEHDEPWSPPPSPAPAPIAATGRWRLRYPREGISVGMEVMTMHNEIDDDDGGVERITPAGTVGEIKSRNNNDVWNVVYPNGAWVCPTEAELLDPDQYLLFVKE